MLSQTEARELVERCMRVLYYRDARSYNRVRSVNSKWGSNWQAVQFLSLYTLKNLYFEGHLSILHISEKPST